MIGIRDVYMYFILLQYPGSPGPPVFIAWLTSFTIFRKLRTMLGSNPKGSPPFLSNGGLLTSSIYKNKYIYIYIYIYGCFRK